MYGRFKTIFKFQPTVKYSLTSEKVGCQNYLQSCSKIFVSTKSFVLRPGQWSCAYNDWLSKKVMVFQSLTFEFSIGCMEFFFNGCCQTLE